MQTVKRVSLAPLWSSQPLHDHFLPPSPVIARCNCLSPAAEEISLSASLSPLGLHLTCVQVRDRGKEKGKAAWKHSEDWGWRSGGRNVLVPPSAAAGLGVHEQ